MRSLPWRFLGLAVVAGMASPLAMLVLRDRCLYWTGGPMPWEAIAAVVLNVVIAAAYFGIPLELWRAAREGRRLPLPGWLRAAFLSYAFFIFSCGLTHLERAFSRPVVYCGESVAVLAICAAFSLTSWVGTRVCRPVIAATIRALGAVPGLMDAIASLSTPGLASDVLRIVERTVGRHGTPPQ